MFEVRPGVWGLLLGDITGVGPEAAALTGVARYAARALASQECSPARLLTQLNDTLVHFDLHEKFCTAIYAELQLNGDVTQVKISNAGHPYPFVIRADGQVAEVEAQGTLLGLLADITLEERELTLSPGDVMVCYTDGIIEARSPSGELFGTEGLGSGPTSMCGAQCGGGTAHRAFRARAPSRRCSGRHGYYRPACLNAGASRSRPAKPSGSA
jgi:serine phosphatase RsbU (regulator of sigma subunit)